MPRLVITLLIIGGLWWDVPAVAQEVDVLRSDRARPAFGAVPAGTEVAARQALTIQLASSLKGAVDWFIKADNRGDVSTSVRPGTTPANAVAASQPQTATLSVRVGMFVEDVTENLVSLFRTVHSDHYACTQNVKDQINATANVTSGSNGGPVREVLAKALETIRKSCSG